MTPQQKLIAADLIHRDAREVRAFCDRHGTHRVRSAAERAERRAWDALIVARAAAAKVSVTA
jgi:hypothetical protein